jgi:tripartite ATP-independent transporter DctM subunit
MAGLPHLIPVLLVFAIIIGSIYTGWATPTEAAAIGVVMALGIAAFYGAVTWANMRAALLGTIRTTSMVMFVIVGAYFLNFALGATGLNRALSGFLEGFGLGPYGMLMIIVLMYIVLGFFIETLALMIATIPIVVPIVIGLGFDKVWFGILLIVLIEMALITPPVGLNLYVVQGARKEGRLSDVMVGAIPFVFVMLVMVGLLIAFPSIALLFAPG